MRNLKLTIAATFAIGALVGAWGVQTLEAQDKRTFIRRDMLQKHDLSVKGREAVQILAELSPGAATGKHTHPGEELGYLLEGTLVLEVEGKKPITLRAGDVFFVPPRVVHDGKNTGKGLAKVLLTYVVEKGKPLAPPVK